MNIYHRLDDQHSICFETMTMSVTVKHGSTTVTSGYKLERYLNAFNEPCWRVVNMDSVLANLLDLMMFQTKVELLYLGWIIERDMLT